MIKDYNITYEDYIKASTYECKGVEFLYTNGGYLVALVNKHPICRVDLERVADLDILPPEYAEYGKIYHLSELLASTPVGARGDISELTFKNLQEVK